MHRKKTLNDLEWCFNFENITFKVINEWYRNESMLPIIKMHKRLQSHSPSFTGDSGWVDVACAELLRGRLSLQSWPRFTIDSSDCLQYSGIFMLTELTSIYEG